MAELKITYEMLFDVLRRERNREELQELEETFFSDVATYLAQKKSLLATSSSPDTTLSADAERTRVQYHNIKKILGELYLRREKKISSLALNVVRTGMIIDKKSFLEHEKTLFDDLVAVFSNHRRKTLDTVLSGVSLTQEPFTNIREQELIPTKQSTPTNNDTPPKNSSQGILVRFLKPLPRFAGLSGEVFGPYKVDEQAQLPTQIASVLIKKGRVEEVEEKRF